MPEPNSVSRSFMPSQPLSLLTDFYQLTMAYGYWKSGKSEDQAVFHLFFRKPPFHGGYTVTAGLGYVIDFLENLRFTRDDLAYLASQRNAKGTPLFEPAFLDYLEHMEFSCDIHAMPEGTLAFPQEPILRVEGPIIQCQLLETALLNIINFQTLIATKSARINHAAQGDTVMEFGLRRAQGIDGGMAASRAAYLGGCTSTSNVLAGKQFGIPVAGTHAHSWVMAFEEEKEAFEAYAAAFPENCVFLVDTYQTEQGTRAAIEVGLAMKARGKNLAAIRIDSGDLAYFSTLARQMLDEAGLQDTKIVASNDLDEYIIHSLKTEQKAPIDIWGVGTKLVTAFDQPALGAVYKMSKIKPRDGVWRDTVKLSEQAIKVNNPGQLQVRRYFNAKGLMVGDLIFDASHPMPPDPVMIDPADATRQKRPLKKAQGFQDLLVPLFLQGKRVYPQPELSAIRQTVREQMNLLDASNKRLVNPHVYAVGLEQGLYNRKMQLILQMREREA
jgi:nicotinate phosphoribosyltransferase